MRPAEMAAEIARDIRRELVCCDVYDRLQASRDERDWRTDRTAGHNPCFWGEAAARIAESHAVLAARDEAAGVPEEKTR